MKKTLAKLTLEEKIGQMLCLGFYAESSTGKEFLERALQKAMEVDVLVIALFSSLRSGKGSIGLNERQVDPLSIPGCFPVGHGIQRSKKTEMR